MTAAYAFTGYRSQGQALSVVMVDIASPPTGGLSLFNLYVALSRSSSRLMIRLLCDFTDKVFEAIHCPELLAFNDTINELSDITTQWRRRMVRTQCNS